MALIKLGELGRVLAHESGPVIDRAQHDHIGAGPVDGGRALVLSGGGAGRRAVAEDEAERKPGYAGPGGDEQAAGQSHEIVSNCCRASASRVLAR